MAEAEPQKPVAETTASSSGNRSFADSRWFTAAVVLICTALLGWTQFSFGGLDDSDSYFHTRAARELDLHGVQKRFPQAAFSTWSERYADKDFLFHLVLIPFQRIDRGAPEDGVLDDLVPSGKGAAVFVDFLVLASLGFALHAVGARFAAFWLALFFAIDVNLLNAFLPVRPGLLGVALVILEIVFIVRRRGAWLGVVGALHTLSHSSFVLLPFLLVAAVAAHLLRGERYPLRVIAWGLGGLAVASLLNPYFPNNLSLAWHQTVDVASHVWREGTAIPRDLFGAELMPTRIAPFLATFPGYAPALCGLLGLAIFRRRISSGTLSLALTCCVLLIAALLSQRFLEFFYPLSTLLAAASWTELLAGATLRQARRAHALAFWLSAGILVACPLAGLADGNIVTLNRHVRTMPTEEARRPAVEFLRNAARPDELVYHNFWWDFSVLYHYRPDGRYVVALDPVFFERHDPERFGQALEAYRGRSADLYVMLKRDFGARWVFVQKSPQFLPFFDLVRSDGRFEKAYDDANVVIARVP